MFATVTVDGKTYQMGDLGSHVLPVTPEENVTTWRAGSTPRVAWGMRYNVGVCAAVYVYVCKRVGEKVCVCVCVYVCVCV